MIRQSATDLLELVTSTAQAVHYDVAWLEDDTAADTVQEGSAAAVVSAAATTVVSAAPGANKSRRLLYASITNKGASLNVVTVQKDVAGTNIEEARANLMPGEALRYSSNTGWQVFDTEGRAKPGVAGSQTYVTNAMTVVALGSDQTNNNAVANSLQDVTGLSFAVNAGETYYFKFTVNYTAAATGTGSRWTINGPAAPSLLSYSAIYTLTATTQSVNYSAAYQLPAASNATSLTAGNIAIVEGYVQPSVTGTIQLQFASEVASSAIVAKAGSILQWMRVL